jgi:hypothetical protein
MKRNTTHNIINGTAGDDTIAAFDGEDLVYAGDGNDVIHDGTLTWDDDIYYGQKGDDFIFVHGGNDQIFGGAGHDTVESNTLADFSFDGGFGQDEIDFYLPETWTFTLTNFEDERTVVKLYDADGDLRQKITTHDVEVFNWHQ